MISMTASGLWAFSTLLVWTNCKVSIAGTQSHFDDSLPSSPIPAAAIRSSAESNGNSTCRPGSGKEHHQVVNASGEIWPYQMYKSAPFNPPELKITTNDQPLAPGLLFITPSDGSTVEATKSAGPLIMTDAGQLVWNGPLMDTNNFRVASFEGGAILTYWSGSTTSAANIGHGYGNVTFLDDTYNEILNVCPQFGLLTPDNTIYPCEADLHESFVTDRDTLLVTAYNVTTTDLSSIGGPVKGWVYDCLFFELDPRNGDILFRWSALEHVSVSDTRLDLADHGGLNQSIPFDFFHINSVVNIGNQFLVNSRHFWTTYLTTAEGDIIWTLQGDTGGDFGALPTNGHFAWQHHARPHRVTETSITLSYFNNYNSGYDNGTHPSDGLVLQLSVPPNKSNPPQVIDYLSDPSNPIYADSQGSTTILPDGHVFLGYGEISVLKEFGPSDPSGGDVRWTARFGFNNLVQSYRGFKTKWQGFPTTHPDLFVEKNGNGCQRGYVSWNGATSVEDWIVYEGGAEDKLSQVRRLSVHLSIHPFMITRHGIASARGLLRQLPPPASCSRSFSALRRHLKEHGSEGNDPTPNESEYDYRKPSYAARRNFPEHIRHLMRSTPNPLTVIISRPPFRESQDDAFATGEHQHDESAPEVKENDMEQLNKARGILVSSFTTVTLFPKPYVSFNIKLPSNTYFAMQHYKVFTASGLKDTRVADAFAKRKPKFRDVWSENVQHDLVEVDGRLKKGMGGTWWMRCRILPDKCVQVGDHVVVVAKVVESGGYEGGEGIGLVYAEGEYRKVGEVVDTEKEKGDIRSELANS